MTSGLLTRGPLAVCPGSRHGIVSRNRRRATISHFWGQNTEAPPYPSARAFHRHQERIWRSWAHFGIVSRAAYRQALAGLSWLSSSPLQICWSTRAWSSARLRLSPAEGSPRRHTLYEPSWPEPRGRICGRVPLTCFEHDGSGDGAENPLRPESVCIAHTPCVRNEKESIG